MEPLHDSRAFTGPAEVMVAWWRDVLLIEPYAVVDQGDSTLVSFAFPTTVNTSHNATVQYVARPAREGDETNTSTTAWFQHYLNSVARE